MTRLTAGLLAATATLAFTSCATPAQTQNLKPAAENPIAIADRAGPKLTALVRGINDEEAERDLDISNLDIAVYVRGSIARTTLTATFVNPLKTEDLEGRFVLNMPRGAVINGYALDINGQMIDGVLETKYNAAEAYQKRVNRRIDPGLAEVDYSDRFETRIYPIPAEGKRTIRLVMVSQFDPASGYALPLTVGGKVGKFTMGVSGDAKVKGVPAGLNVHPYNEASNVALKGDFRLEATSTAPMLVSQHSGTDAFFEISGALPRGAIDRHKPLHILWDRSLSRTDDNLKDEAQLAEDLALKRGLRRATITLFDSGKVETKDVAADRISETLADARYRGATSYASLQSLAIAPGADCLMFSDGRVTIDDRKDFLPACAVTAITSGPERDDAWLGDLAQRTGGALHVLTKANAETVFGLLDKPDAAILAVTDGTGKAIETAPLASDRRNFRLVGPVPADAVVLVKVEGETSPRRFNLATTVSIPFEGPGALWARHRLGVVAAETNPDDMAALARRYNIATPQASFIVLETPADYVEAKINPPLSYPRELRTAYADLREAADAEASEHRAERLTQVVNLWEAQKDWWKRDFKGPDPKKDQGPRPRPGAEATATPPPPSSPAAAPEARSAPADRDNVVVTANRREETVQDIAVDVTAITDEVRRELGLDGADAGSASREGSISVAEWKPDRPYIAKLDKAGEAWEQVIDTELTTSGALPLFWFDIAEWHWQKGRKDEARRAVESALDLPTRDNQTLAIVAARLLRYGSHDRAIWLLERLAEREATRPQPKRKLATALLERAKVDANTVSAKADMVRAIDLLAKAATDVYEQESDGIETVALMEANAALAKLKAMGGSSTALDPRLVALLDADLRVVVEWNTPRTDLDLWVLEPKGYEVGYSAPLSPWGGKLSGDITDGYGPEEYLIHKALTGEYKIRAKTFASDPTNPNGPSSLTVRLIRNFGRPGQSEELMDIEMEARDREKVDLGKITIK